MTTIGATLILRDGYRHDYPWREAAQSVLPVCSELVICDAGSTDGTLEAVQEWSEADPRIKLRHWTPEAPNHNWLLSWMNHARQQLSTSHHLFITADEVLHEDSYDDVLRFVNDHPNGAANCHTRNFWFNSKLLIPHGHTCGHRGYRLSPTRMWMLADWPDERGREMMDANVETEIEIYHYNWLRKPANYVEKEKLFQQCLTGSHDARFDDPKLDLKEWAKPSFYSEPLIPFDKPHPKIMERWLKERGHLP